MKPSPFDYHRPATLDEALGLLQAHEDARLLAGGQSLIPAMNFRLAAPEVLIDLGDIAALRDITVDQAGNLKIGAMASHADCQRSQTIQEGWPLIAEALAYVAHAQVRHRGTIGGSLAHADPAAEWPALCVALDATLTVTGPAGTRNIAAVDFFQGVYATSLEAHDILTAITFPAWPSGRRWGFHEVSRRQGDFALAGAAVVIDTHDGQICSHAKAVLFGVADTPVALPALTRRLERAELPPAGFGPDHEAAEESEHTFFQRCDDLAWFARTAVEPRSDLHADAAYRQDLIQAVVALALRQAAGASATKLTRSAQAPRSEGPVPADKIMVNGRLMESVGQRANAHATPESQRNAPANPSKTLSRITLADHARDNWRLTGTHIGCEHGVCGACTVLIDGESARACLMFARQAEGRAVTTIEGLTPANGELSDLQQQFVAHHALQCGFCTPGMIVSAEALLRENPSPTADEVREALSGNICRCTGYVSIIEAVLATARLRQGETT